MLRLLKVLPLTLSLAVLSFLTASCGSNSAQARFVNALSDTADYNNAGLDVDFNTAKYFTDITFPQASASTYTSVPSGSDTIEGLQTNTTTSVFANQTLSLSSGTPYTLVATGVVSRNNVALKSFTDNNTAPANGSVNFRIINASFYGPNGGGAAVDVYILPNPNPIFPTNGCAAAAPNCIPDVSFQNASAYVTLPYNSSSGGWQMYVTLAGDPQPDFNATIGGFGSSSEGAICTLVLVDQQGGTSTSSTPIALNDLNGCTTIN